MNKLAIITAIINEANIVPKTKTGTKKLSKKAEEIVAFINKSDFGCKKQIVIDLMSIVTGENLSQPKVKVKPGFVAKVVIDEHSDDAGNDFSEHNFESGDLVLCITNTDNSEDYFVAATDISDVTYMHPNEYVRASASEIKSVLAKIKSLNEDNMSRLLKKLI